MVCPTVIAIVMHHAHGINLGVADVLGSGSTQDSQDQSKDDPFWDALNAEVKNLHGVISGHGNFARPTRILTFKLTAGYTTDHGNEWCKREPSKNVIFCFDKHSG